MRVALLFPGQGAQYPGMGKNLYDSYPTVKHLFEEASDITHLDLRRICFESTVDNLKQTEKAQLAIFLVSFAQYTVLNSEFQFEPYLSAGHSLGEITALTCAGAIKFQDGIQIVHQRGRAMQEIAQEVDGGMVAVMGLDRTTVQNECESLFKEGFEIVIANYNSDKQFVIAGVSSGLSILSRRLESQGGRTIFLKVNAPFHTQFMSAAAEKLGAFMKNLQFNAFNWPVISNVTGKPHITSWQAKEDIVRQIISPVLWSQTMLYMKNKIDVFINVGPSPVLENIARNNLELEPKQVISMDEPLSRTWLNQMWGKNRVKFIKYPRKIHLSLISSCLAEAASTKNRNDNVSEYEQGVIRPYARLVELYEEIEKKDTEITISQVKEAISLLEIILNTKKLPSSEKESILNKIKNMISLREKVTN
ncbi:[acyl-carrier-protein] S-malonyltransferase [Paenibacillus sp. JGP012]|uniref:ACP S-malonyltransferase n=1 Tax=Paenibacillus sp. JGP012 TaxID=2735914 RepID=UPI00160DF0FD|nr:ACP S-malonyltransferase [Paenibacillus sp. JGP012]MBB6022777.1 [acyl-carrier-protein] S-malonyltransferase [Paenibacillus sp. JGP012]